MNPDPNLCRQKKDDGKNLIDLLIIVASGPAMFIYLVFISILSSFFLNYIPFAATTRLALLCCCQSNRTVQCCFNSTPDPFKNKQPILFLKPPKVIESRTYVKKANLECYWNNTVLLLWQQHNRASLISSWERINCLQSWVDSQNGNYIYSKRKPIAI